VTIIACPNCKKVTSTEDRHCKHCGEETNKKSKKLNFTSVIIFVVFVLLVVLIYSKNQSQKEPELKQKLEENAKLFKEEQAKIELQKQIERNKKESQYKALLAKKMKSLTDQELSSLLSECRSKVESRADRDNKSPYSIALIREYSSDKQLAIASMSNSDSILSTEQRIKEFREDKFSHTINSKYPVLFVRNTSFGTVREIKIYECIYTTDLSIAVNKL
jgi:predicted nucleic acid-binding Zn ribbon protein